MLTILTHALHKVGERVSEWRKLNRAYGELYALDDRSLADIGLTRSEIPYILSHESDDSYVAPRATARHDFRHAA